MTIDDFFEFLSKYMNGVEGAVRQKIEIEKSNSGFNRNSPSPYAYMSFYPQEIDLIFSLERKDGCFQILIELMNQEGQDPELALHLEGGLSEISFEMNNGFGELISKICDRLNRI